MTNDKNINRFTLYTGGLGESNTGKWVEYEEHLAIVEKLKAEIVDLKVKAEEAYREGYGVGNSVGYCQGLMGED